MTDFTHDLRYALRTLVRRPGFALTSVLILGLGIGAATAIFTVVDGVLLRPLPYPQSERIVSVQELSQKGHPMRVAGPNYDDFRDRSHSFKALAQMSVVYPVSVIGGSEPVRAMAVAVSRDFFRVMGVQPAVGRAFTPDEQRVGAPPAVIISDDFWKQSLGGGSISGRTLTFEQQVYSVVGVMPPGFAYPHRVDLWTPSEAEPPRPSRTAHNWMVVGRLADGVSIERAREEIRAIAHHVKAQYGSDVDMVDAAVTSLRDEMVGDVRTPLLVFLGATGVLLLIAVANVSNLLMVRLAARRQEMAVRVALGAGFRPLLRQLLAESLVLSLVSGAVGAMIARIGAAVLLAFHPAYMPRMDEVSVNPSVLFFALGLSLLVAAALSVLAVFHGMPKDLRGELATGQRTLAGSGSGRITRDALVVLQAGLTLVLLTGAALMGRSIMHLLAVDPGFRTDHILVMNVTATSPDDSTRVRDFDSRLLDRLRTLPGVRAVGGVSDFPLQDNGPAGSYVVMNTPDEVTTLEQFGAMMKIPSRVGQADWRVASPGYFEAMGIPLVRGRLFGDEDSPSAHVTAAVVSESFANKQWPGQDPIGRLIQFGNMDGDMRALRIVGVVGGVHEYSLAGKPGAALYAYFQQRPGSAGRFHIAMWTRGEPNALIPAARRAPHQVDPNVPPTFTTISPIVSNATADRRFGFVLVSAFGAAALVLAVAGVYAVISYLVAQRTREIGVRLAFGAHGADVIRLVITRAAALVLGGIALGVAVSLALTHISASMLYGIEATDPIAYVSGALLLAAVAVLASYVPARRAAMLDPVVALRAE